MKVKSIATILLSAVSSLLIANPLHAATLVEYDLRAAKLISPSSLRLRVLCASSAVNANGDIPLAVNNGQLQAIGTVGASNERFQYQSRINVVAQNDGRYALIGHIDLVDTSATDILARPFVRLGISRPVVNGHMMVTQVAPNADGIILTGGGVFADGVACLVKLVTQ